MTRGRYDAEWARSGHAPARTHRRVGDGGLTCRLSAVDGEAMGERSTRDYGASAAGDTSVTFGALHDEDLLARVPTHAAARSVSGVGLIAYPFEHERTLTVCTRERAHRGGIVFASRAAKAERVSERRTNT